MPIIDFPGYEISSFGRIKSFWSNGNMHSPRKVGLEFKYLKPFRVGNYSGISLGKNKKFYIHRLVAQMFIENPNNYKEVNHIDENKNNNCVSNLEWCTRQQNEAHSSWKIKRGEDHYKAKLTWAIVDYIRSSPLRGFLLSKEINVSEQEISRIRKFQRWSKKTDATCKI